MRFFWLNYLPNICFLFLKDNNSNKKNENEPNEKKKKRITAREYREIFRQFNLKKGERQAKEKTNSPQSSHGDNFSAFEEPTELTGNYWTCCFNLILRCWFVVLNYCSVCFPILLFAFIVGTFVVCFVVWWLWCYLLLVEETCLMSSMFFVCNRTIKNECK